MPSKSRKNSKESNKVELVVREFWNKSWNCRAIISLFLIDFESLRHIISVLELNRVMAKKKK